jgi:hypothetical protein
MVRWLPVFYNKKSFEHSLILTVEEILRVSVAYVKSFVWWSFKSGWIMRPLDLKDESSEFFVQIVSGLGGLEAGAVCLLPFVDLEEVVESHARETLAIRPTSSCSVGPVGRDGDLSVKRGLAVLEPNTGTSSLGFEFGLGSAGGANNF